MPKKPYLWEEYRQSMYEIALELAVLHKLKRVKLDLPLQQVERQVVFTG